MVAADSKAKFLQDAERYVLHGKVQQAIGEYLKIIKFDPNDVLILNTIGDLYLRQGNRAEANKYFSQVAENYVKNNFFLKAIAVYKKILNADPNNLEINSVMASLYAKQGLSIDARNQYQRIATLLEKEGKTRESMEAYEKIVELDPANSKIQRKLAELYLLEGQKEKAHDHFTGAARAQAKAGDFAGAADCYGRAMDLDPLDIEPMRGFFDCCLKLKNPGPALEQLTKSVELAPENLDLREMLGKAHLANGDPEKAAKAFQIVVSMDEARYENFFDVGKVFVDRKEYDQAVASLDSIIPVLISRRETERAVRFYELVLQLRPNHIHSMTRCASIYSATGDQARYLEKLDEIADYYLGVKSPIEAIEYLEKILQTDPLSEKHRKLHRQVFTEAYPDTPYVAPAEPPEEMNLPVTGPSLDPTVEKKETSSNVDKRAPSEIVEVDLMINYGLREKALSLLLSLESRDPYDKEVRLRLLSIYKAENKSTEAAEQCLLLAALYRRSKNEDSALVYLNEAKQLAPEMAEYEKNLESFARRNGIEPLESPAAAPTAGAHAPDSEVDLSSDLLDIFFSGDQESGSAEEPAEDENHELIVEPFPQSIPQQASAKSIQEQLQEVDFYIRLGFHDEALGKLNELAKISPDNPELASRYQKLGEIDQPASQQPVAAASFESPAEPLFGEPIQSTTPDNIEVFRELELDGTLDNFAQNAPLEFDLSFEESPRTAAKAKTASASAASRIQPPAPEEFEKPEIHANEMFSDLMDEFGAVSDQELSKESFDDHFSLGTAYRDMELSEEAIREFQLALKIADLKKDNRAVVQCCGMLSTCFLKKGMPSSALRWCQTGLNISDISSHEAMALRYDMGIAHSMSGSNDRALECFNEIFALDPGYRDVAQKIDELRTQH